jgi:hypothetical protein
LFPITCARVASEVGRNGIRRHSCLSQSKDCLVGEGQIIVERAPVSTGREALVTEANHYRLFAGWRSDPFFFDRRGMLNNL